MDWGYEEYQCRALLARTIDMAFDTDSERVPIEDVMKRRVWFPHGGAFFLWDEYGRLMYIGTTAGPLRQRLYMAMLQRKTWALMDYSGWAVSMQRAPVDYAEELLFAKRLIAKHEPPFNMRGRPRKPRELSRARENVNTS